MWSDLLTPHLHVVAGDRRDLRHFGQEVTHHILHSDPDGVVRWFDGEHGFNPYHFAELNLTRGHQADHGADRILVKRCLTAFQWETQMDTELDEVLGDPDTVAALAIPYDALFRHQELQDWEQEDYLHYNLGHLRRLIPKHRKPILAFCDLDRLWQSHPSMAAMIVEAAQERWHIERPGGRWRLTHDATGRVIDPYLRRHVTLQDFMEPEPVAVPVPVPLAVPNAPAPPLPTVLPPRSPRRFKVPQQHT